MSNKLKQAIRYTISVALFLVIQFSDYKPLIICAYLFIVHHFTSLFLSVTEINSPKISLSEDQQQLLSEENKSSTPVFIFGVVIQLISFLIVFTLTWYVVEKKLHL